ncbi:MAG: hypothetical protein ABUT39_13235 [Acidobacteriota bacterium]
MIAKTETPNPGIAPETLDFYRRVMIALQKARVPFLVGGAYAFARYTGIVRHTKDFDIFVHPRDFDRTLDELGRGAGCQVERPFPHWLGKGYCGHDFVDVIFSSGNGIARVDDLWFERAVDEEVLGIPARLCPAEEMIWSKSFILERERYDGGDVAHILRARAEEIDWDRLLARFGPTHGPVLLTHLILFRYIYPGEADRIPARVMDELVRRMREGHSEGAAERLCRGTILSRSQYLVDVEHWGYRDARLEPVGPMTKEELAIWTRAADEEVGRPYTDVEEVR